MDSVTILIKHSGYLVEYNIFLWLAIVWIKTDFRFDFVGNISLYNLILSLNIILFIRYLGCFISIAWGRSVMEAYYGYLYSGVTGRI